MMYLVLPIRGMFVVSTPIKPISSTLYFFSDFPPGYSILAINDTLSTTSIFSQCRKQNVSMVSTGCKLDQCLQLPKHVDQLNSRLNARVLRIIL